MLTISKQEAITFTFLQAKADVRKYENQILFLEKKHGLSFSDFEQNIKTFEQEDDYIDWKAAIEILAATRSTLKDLESGNFNIA